MEQLESQLGGADVRLDAEVLDRIDEIVPAGTSICGTTPSQRAHSAQSLGNRGRSGRALRLSTESGTHDNRETTRAATVEWRQTGSSLE